VTDLAAVRNGDQVTLSWTMPRHSTDKLLLKEPVSVRICRSEGGCLASALTLTPGAAGTLTETLRGDLATGSVRVLTYTVELKNRRDRSAGVSNNAVVLTGAAPASIENFKAEMRREGVVLRWTPGGSDAAVRFRRTLIASSPTASVVKASDALLARSVEPANRTLLVEPGVHGDPGHALDAAISFGQNYEYRAQRLLRIQVNGQTLELASDLTPPLRIEAKNIFPPAVPTGLAAVSSVAKEAAHGIASIDLSWQPNSEADLAGYRVYRRQGEADWQLVSGAQPTPVPAFHDAAVQAGNSYHYAVTAVSQNGMESARSGEAVETVPTQETLPQPQTQESSQKPQQQV
jgi:hypothetical protein